MLVVGDAAVADQCTFGALVGCADLDDILLVGGAGSSKILSKVSLFHHSDV